LGDSGVVAVGDIVLFNPDADSQAIDRANGYTLGMCMGRVEQINKQKSKVELWWLFGHSWSSNVKWILWREPKTKLKYTEWVDVDSLLVTSFGTLAKINLVSYKGRETFTIDRDSVEIVKDVINTNEE
jgi:hypothetical protein